MVDVRALDTFLTVLRTGAVGKTADRLNVTQSAVSRRLQTLESALDAPLFDRVGRTVRPNALALSVAEHAETALAAIEAMVAAAKDEEAKVQDLRIAATPQTIAQRIAPVVTRLRDAGIRPRIVETGGAEVADLVLQDMCDCGLSTHPPLEAGLQHLPLGQLLLTASGAAMAARQGETVDIATLFDADLLCFTQDFQARRRLDAVFHLSNRRPRIVYEGQSSRAIHALAQAGMGIAVLPDNAIDDPDRKIITQMGRPLQLDVTLMWRTGSRRGETVRKLALILTGAV